MIRKIKHFIEFLFTLAAGVCIRVLNPFQAHRLGAFLGRTAFKLGVGRKVSMDNLRHAFPDKADPELAAIGAEALGNFGITMLDILRMPLIDPRQLFTEFEFEGLELFEETLKQGRGGLCLSAHFGNWEWMGAALVA